MIKKFHLFQFRCWSNCEPSLFCQNQLAPPKPWLLLIKAQRSSSRKRWFYMERRAEDRSAVLPPSPHAWAMCLRSHYHLWAPVRLPPPRDHVEPTGQSSSATPQTQHQALGHGTPVCFVLSTGRGLLLGLFWPCTSLVSLSAGVAAAWSGGAGIWLASMGPWSFPVRPSARFSCWQRL